MTYTESQLNTLNAAIAQGALSVQYGDKLVTYRSLKEMYQIREDMRRELGLLGNNANPGRRYATHSKGL